MGKETHPKKRGIFRRYLVEKIGGGHAQCRYFVLDLDCDPHAKAAMEAYARSCHSTHPRLALDILKGLETGQWGELP